MIDFALGMVSAFAASFVPGQLLAGKAYVPEAWVEVEKDPRTYWTSVSVQTAVGAVAAFLAFMSGAFS